MVYWDFVRYVCRFLLVWKILMEDGVIDRFFKKLIFKFEEIL